MGGRHGEPEPRTLRIGAPSNYFYDGLESSVRGLVERAAERAGARPIRLPDCEPLIEIARITLLSEAAAVWGSRVEHKNDAGADVWDLLEKGRKVTAVQYLEAQRRRRKLAREFAAVWREVDCLITPACPFPAFPIEHQEDLRPATTRFTRPFNLLGWPALVIPAGTTREGLPVGLQLIAAPGREDVLFEVGERLENA